MVGIRFQREIEQAVAKAIAAGDRGTESFRENDAGADAKINVQFGGSIDIGILLLSPAQQMALCLNRASLD